MAPKPSYEELENRLNALKKENMELKRKADQYKGDHKKYSAIYDHWYNCIYIHDLAGNFIDANDASLGLLGYEKENIASLNFSSLLEKDQLPIAVEIIDEILQTGSHREMAKFRLKRKDGNCVWIETGGSLIHRNGKPWAIIGIARDVTDRVNARNTIEEKEARYQSLFENAPIGIGIADTHGKIINFNDAALAPGGYTAKDIIKINNIEKLYFDPNSRKKILSTLNSDGFVDKAEVQFKAKDGLPYDCLLSLIPVQYEGKECIEAIIQDITKLKSTEKNLRENRQRVEAIVESTSDWIWEVDENAVYTYCNKKVTDILGYEPAEIIGKTPFDLMPTSESEKIANIFKNIVDLQEQFSELENINLHKDGHQVVLETSGVPIWGENSEFMGYRGIDRDITARRQMMNDLKQAQNDLENKVERRTVELRDANLNLKNEIEERKQVEKNLRFHISFENLITSISTNFIKMSLEEIDSGLNSALENLGEFAGVDRCFFLLFSDDKKSLQLSHQWCADSIPPITQKDVLQTSKTEFAQWTHERILRGETIHVPQVIDLASTMDSPEGFHEIVVERFHAQSFLLVPMIFGETVIGMMGVDTVQNEKHWPEDIITLFNIIGKVFANLIQRKNTEQIIREREAELRIKSENLEEMNAALKILLEKRDSDRIELEEKMLSNINQLIEPYLVSLKQTSLSDRQFNLLTIIETNLNEIISPFARNYSSKYFKFTPKEIQIANFIKKGITTKEIAKTMGVSIKTIEFHRNNIRNKLGLKDGKANLRTRLLSFE